MSKGRYTTPRPLRLILYSLAILGATFTVIFSAFQLLDLTAIESTSSAREFTRVKAVDVTTGNGNVKINAAPKGSKVGVRTTSTRGLSGDGSLTDGSVVRDSTLFLDDNCMSFMVFRCTVGYDIDLPDGVAVNTRLATGELMADGIRTTEPVTLKSGAGGIVVRDLNAPKVRLHSGAGDVRASRLQADEVTAATGAGTVKLSFRKAPRKMSVASAAGDIFIAVPDGTYKLKISTGIGKLDTSGIRTDPQAKHEIKIESALGDVTVVGAG